MNTLKQSTNKTHHVKPGHMHETEVIPFEALQINQEAVWITAAKEREAV